MSRKPDTTPPASRDNPPEKAVGDKLGRKVDALPAAPGVYVFRDRDGRVIYVGKAVSLRNRVRSYFRAGSPPDPKTGLLVREIADLEYIRTPGEAEAFFLESRLVKGLQPRYNIDLRDDKSFPCLRLSGEPFPRLAVVRERKTPDATYFGPFTEAAALRQAVHKLREIFPLAACRRRFDPDRPIRPCLDFDLKRCLAPCAGKVSPEEYQRVVKALAAFFLGRKTGVIRELQAAMHRAAGQMRFEEAARLRDEVRALKTIRRHPRALGVERPTTRAHLNLREALGLAREPLRVEGYDISNLFGREAVGSLVVFLGGEPYRGEYRRFRIRGPAVADDYGMLAQVLRRRSGEKGWALPDLVLVDGGRGQVETARRALAEAGLDIPLVGLAKEEERFFLPGRPAPLALSPASPEGLFLRRVRDEAHRFALAYHRALRARSVSRSALDVVPGLGPARRQKLLARYPSLAAIRAAPLAELRALGIPAAVARRLRESAAGGAPGED